MIESLLEGERLLLHGLVDRAERIYRGILDQDPKNAIAMVGLARVALERADDEQALRTARAALEIDPDNAAAQRLVARLTEVIAAGNPSQRRPASEEPSPAAGRESEQAIFERNPSMADHRRREGG
jgi:predicted Zn-dependent protease